MNQSEKDDRKDRYDRRRGQAKAEVNDNDPRPRKAPYKRQHKDYNDYLEPDMLDDWFEQDM